MPSATSIQEPALPAETAIGQVRLRVPDLGRALSFYRDTLGFAAVSELPGGVVLGICGADTGLIQLNEAPGISRASRNAAGLYHFAVLLPKRSDLARFVRHLSDQAVPFGHSDHAVSEALYFEDPDGNGIEVYADRPRSSWTVQDGIVHFTGDPIDFQDLLGELEDGDDRWRGAPEGTRIGHVHLRVNDLERSQSFFVDRLGFDVSADYVRGATFVSAGGYHHHLGMNVWESHGRPLAGDDVAGLDSFTIVLPDRESWEAAVRRLGGEPGDEPVYRMATPDGIQIDFAHSG